MISKQIVIKYASLAVTLLVLLFLANNLAKLFWSSRVNSDITFSSDKLENSGFNNEIDLYGMSELAFKKPQSQPNQSVQYKDSDISSLVTLQGIYLEDVSGKDELKSSIAIIDYNKQIKALHVGEFLAPGIKLLAINKDNISLLYNGTAQTVHLNYQTLASVENLVSGNRNEYDKNQDQSLISGERTINNKVKNDALLNQLANNPIELMDYVDFKNQQLGNSDDTGIAVYNKKDIDVLSKFGLQNGDILLAINELRITQNNIFELMNKLKADNSTKTVLKVLRNGSIKLIKVEF